MGAGERSSIEAGGIWFSYELATDAEAFVAGHEPRRLFGSRRRESPRPPVRLSPDSDGYRANAALKGVSLSIRRGEFVGVVGSNGSGKTTLARHLDALLPLQEGFLRVAGWDASDPSHLWELRRSCAMVFQNPENQFVSSIVGEDVAFGPVNYGASPEQCRERVSGALEQVGLPGYEGRDVYELSGGQKQRAAIAGVLALDPDVIVLDEATSLLDPQGRDEVLSTIRRLHDERALTVVAITHDMELAAGADHVIVLADGRVIADGAPGEVLGDETVLSRAGLQPPLAVQVGRELERRGFDIAGRGKIPVTVDGLVGSLCGSM